MKAFLVDSPRSGALRALNYAPAVERIRRAGSASARPLHTIVKTFGPAYGTVFTRLDCEPDYGIELLSQSDMFAAEPRGRVIRRDSMREPDKHYIEMGQVLIAGAGTLGENELYGRAVLADKRLAGKYVGPDSMTLVFEDPDDDFSLFAYAWLASPTGVQAIRSASYGTKILRFRSDLLTSLPVPIPSRATVSRVAKLVRTCTTDRAVYFDEMAAARSSLAKILPPLEEVKRGPRFVLWTDSMPSIRAWNFASTGERLRRLRHHWEGELQHWIQPEGIFKGGRVARTPCNPPYGVDLLSQRDVFAIRPVPRRIQAPNPPLNVESNYLLVASRGQMNDGALFGRVERGAHTPSGAAVTEDVMRLVPRDGLGSALFTFLSSTLGLGLLRSTAYGTSIPGMREDLLASLPAPPPEGTWLDETTLHSDKATRARVRASTSESEAFRIIEEEVLPQWLA